MKVKKDISGERFGKLVALYPDKYVSNGSSKVIAWMCRCDCGNYHSVSGTVLRKGQVKSCGCEYKKLDRTLPSFNTLLGKYKYSANKRGLEWSLTEEEFRKLVTSPCYYTGIMPSTVIQNKNAEAFYYNGVDRLDSSKGYTVGNCVACYTPINFMKSDTPEEEFLNLIKQVYEYKELGNV